MFTNLDWPLGLPVLKDETNSLPFPKLDFPPWQSALAIPGMAANCSHLQSHIRHVHTASVCFAIYETEFPFFQPFWNKSAQSNKINGKIKMGKDVLSKIDGNWVCCTYQIIL